MCQTSFTYTCHCHLRHSRFGRAIDEYRALTPLFQNSIHQIQKLKARQATEVKLVISKVRVMNVRH